MPGCLRRMWVVFVVCGGWVAFAGAADAAVAGTRPVEGLRENTPEVLWILEALPGVVNPQTPVYASLVSGSALVRNLACGELAESRRPLWAV